MKRILLIFFASFLITKLYAPVFPVLTILKSQYEVSRPYEPMLIAFEFVESSFDTDTVNRLGYGGILQIGQQMVDEVNRINKLSGNTSRFTLSDRLDSTKSTQMWYIVMDYWNPSYDLKRACFVWNPKASNKYYKKILSVL